MKKNELNTDRVELMIESLLPIIKSDRWEISQSALSCLIIVQAQERNISRADFLELVMHQWDEIFNQTNIGEKMDYQIPEQLKIMFEKLEEFKNSFDKESDIYKRLNEIIKFES